MQTPYRTHGTRRTHRVCISKFASSCDLRSKLLLMGHYGKRTRRGGKIFRRGVRSSARLGGRKRYLGDGAFGTLSLLRRVRSLIPSKRAARVRFPSVFTRAR